MLDLVARKDHPGSHRANLPEYNFLEKRKKIPVTPGDAHGL
jgi:hypothetical protein